MSTLAPPDRSAVGKWRDEDSSVQKCEGISSWLSNLGIVESEQVQLVMKTRLNDYNEVLPKRNASFPMGLVQVTNCMWESRAIYCVIPPLFCSVKCTDLGLTIHWLELYALSHAKRNGGEMLLENEDIQQQISQSEEQADRHKVDNAKCDDAIEVVSTKIKPEQKNWYKTMCKLERLNSQQSVFTGEVLQPSDHVSGGFCTYSSSSMSLCWGDYLPSYEDFSTCNLFGTVPE
ncbi:hypothetical protein DUI87_16551 [Hirundo rustica rustica]|uniref:Uncharacterized protein n=1 Tax=Hirundo rustica rustica TaxID=333673 RepID=A0A3M0K1K1_HIRRU|nr:hypothetical protein DUI87_16551 [Hirundo rustica rustica]